MRSISACFSVGTLATTRFWFGVMRKSPSCICAIAQQSALRAIAQTNDGEFRSTPNQNLVVANVPTEKQAEIEGIAREAGLLAPWSGLRRNSMACVALPTCDLALAESERYMPQLLDALDEKLAAHGL